MQLCPLVQGGHSEPNSAPYAPSCCAEQLSKVVDGRVALVIEMVG